MIEYVVQRNDTIAGVKERFNVTWQQIQRRNPHAVGRMGESGHWFLKEGAKLTFEDQASGKDALTFQDQLERSSQTVTHKVRSGDTLWGLSRTYGVDVKAIADQNNLKNPDLIRVGQVLSIPEIQTLDPEKETETRNPVSDHAAVAKIAEEDADASDARSVEQACLDALAGDIMPMPLYTGEVRIPEQVTKDLTSEERTAAGGLIPSTDKTNAEEASSASIVSEKTGFDLPAGKGSETTPGRFTITSHRPDGSDQSQVRFQYRPTNDTKLFLGLDFDRYRKSAYVDKESDPDLSVLVGISLDF